MYYFIKNSSILSDFCPTEAGVQSQVKSSFFTYISLKCWFKKLQWLKKSGAYLVASIPIDPPIFFSMSVHTRGRLNLDTSSEAICNKNSDFCLAYMTNFSEVSSGGRKGGFVHFRFAKLGACSVSQPKISLCFHPPLWTWGCSCLWLRVPIKFKIYHPLTIDWPFLDQYLPLGSINLDIHFKSSQYLLIDLKNNEK